MNKFTQLAIVLLLPPLYVFDVFVCLSFCKIFYALVCNNSRSNNFIYWYRLTKQRIKDQGHILENKKIQNFENSFLIYFK